MSLQNTGKFRPEKSEPSKNSNQAQREDTSELRLRQVLENNDIDNKYGFRRVEDHSERIGFLINMHTNEILNEDKRLISIVDYYFLKDDGSRFKVSMPFMPYFYILTQKESIEEVTQFLSKKYSGLIYEIDQSLKEDLDLPNHLIGLKQRYLKLYFVNQNDLIKVRKDILSAVRKNRERAKTNTYYMEMLTNVLTNDNFASKKSTNPMENIIDIREYDVPYHVRVSIDKKICCGAWYNVQVTGPNINSEPIIVRKYDLLEPPEPIVLAFDIETTKLPLKFPDSATDQIMMISYMIDAQGYLIINRQIVSSDVDDFEYTPKPEYEGLFTVYNEPDEHNLLRRFFDHIMDVRPHVFVTYNGDFFDWPFVEARAAVYEMDMGTEIGFSKGRDGVYSCRPAMHMDCLCWVKRDSYLPVGSHNLKAVARAKLRYDPVELDPEDMCKMAVEKPQVLSNYSVSDAVATYYLYMKYIHPFIFALCTIIPMEPDEVLRKGSGTLCETLLMVEAFQVNIIFPNKEETDPTQFTSDGHVLHQETYVGGHVEALESGVFRANIPCRFKLSTETLGQLIDSIPNTLRHAVEIEEGVPLDQVINFNEVAAEIKEKLLNLQQQPNRIENPIIYHLDVGAMYPNIILTNRLQPSAIVNEEVCAACDFNRPNAVCQRKMIWTWRGEFMPATRGEYQRIQQQLETEKFPPFFPGGPQRAFHQLSKEEQATIEKKRLSDYSRKAYKKTKVVRIEERTTTVCQKENSFYVDTVRAFRDRRYEYKGLSKKAKQQVALAVKSGNAEDIKSAKSREVLFDSLQLAHKCILNSFYGYVMRRGARWHSMEMAGIVCYTGANIIMKAREIIENVGRPLELDTDGIWCVLPSSFPETFKMNTNHPKKTTIEVSYPNAVLNAMVKDHFTNDQYFQLEDTQGLSYKRRSENSIFFEVDGPYLAMVLPASKEEGKKLKKRYAVFNFDGTLAELKGFEVKRRGELHLIKVFQSSVFAAFLKGNTLEECYASVAKVADYWLDVLYSRGVDMPDSELFELISENRSMSRKLEDYGGQKSTSITTAKRLSEFLGDQMVKDVGLACKFIISKKPDDAPVTERAVPLAIFQTEVSVQRYFLRKWLKDPYPSLDIRDILDWNYYIERLGGTIQKIITIPAAMQGLPNPVPRIKHPPWLHKKMLEKNDVFKQRRINDMFTVKQKNDTNDLNNLSSAPDIEDTLTDNLPKSGRPTVTVTKRKRNNSEDNNQARTWREALGPPPKLGKTKEEITAWIVYQKKKWAWQSKQKRHGLPRKKICSANMKNDANESGGIIRQTTSTLGGFLRRAQRTLLDTSWQIIQITETKEPGVFKLWTLVGQELHQLRLIVPRIFYVNQRTVKNNESDDAFKKCNRILPRAQPVYNLYRYSVLESVFLEYNKRLMSNLTTPGIEGIYETQMSLEFRTILQVGCVCGVKRDVVRQLKDTTNTFFLDQLQIRSMEQQPYLKENADGTRPIKHLYLYHHCSSTDQRAIYSLFLSPSRKALVIVFDTVRTNQMPNLNSMYKAERIAKIQNGANEESLPPSDIGFEVRVETDIKQVYRLLQRALQMYIDEKRGPSILAIQSPVDIATLTLQMPSLADVPLVPVHVQDIESLYNTLEWQKVGARAMIRHYLNSDLVLELSKEQCRYLYIPLGNFPADPTVFGADIYYARCLQKNNFVLWCSPTSKPDLGGREADDNRLLMEFEERSSAVTNIPGCYSSICVELDIDGLAVNTLLQSHKVHEIEGTSTSTTFDTIPQASLDNLVGASTSIMPIPSYDETTLCSAAFRVLKSMANSWLRDISVHRNVFADFQIVHFYRWLCSPQSLLYDPALHRMLHALMKKLFIQLIAEFKRLGSVIIYANFDKIVICTKKRTVEEAISYVEFIVQNIRNRELFHSIEISYNQCWEYLMWLDVANHGGVSGKLPKGLTTVGESEGNSEVANTENSSPNTQENSEDTTEIVMNWNLTEILPEEGNIRANFNTIIAGYISSIHSQLTNSQTGISTPVPQRPLSSQSLTQSAPLGLGAHTSVVDFACELITGEMSQKLFSLVQKINKSCPEYAAPELVYSQKTIKPALEFVKAICRVLSLDSGIENEIRSLRRNMLRLLGIGEFSDIANWSEPFISFVLPEIICKACNHCRDIDLCKDKHKSSNNDIPVWQCPLCNTAYDNTEIEYRLIDALNRKTMAYILQDLQCKKCTQIKMENMTLFCNCAGNFQTLISAEDTLIHINTFLAIAKNFKMPLLHEAAEWIKEMNK